MHISTVRWCCHCRDISNFKSTTKNQLRIYWANNERRVSRKLYESGICRTTAVDIEVLSFCYRCTFIGIDPIGFHWVQHQFHFQWMEILNSNQLNVLPCILCMYVAYLKFKWNHIWFWILVYFATSPTHW